MAMRFMTLGLLPRVPEFTLVELVRSIVYADSEATKNTWIRGLAESHITIAFGGSYPPQRVMLVQHGFAACDVDSFLFLCDLAPCAGMVSQA